MDCCKICGKFDYSIELIDIVFFDEEENINMKAKKKEKPAIRLTITNSKTGEKSEMTAALHDVKWKKVNKNDSK